MAYVTILHLVSFFTVISYIPQAMCSTTPPPLTCYKCDSDYKGVCADGFHSTGVVTEVCAGSCAKSVEKLSNDNFQVTRYSRDCTQKKQVEGCSTLSSSYSIHTECYCNTNFCNGQTGSTPNLQMIILICWVLIFTGAHHLT